MQYTPTLLALAGLAATQAISAPPSATQTAMSLTPTELCLAECEPTLKTSCVAACVGDPKLTAAQVAAAYRCYSTCPEGDKLTCLRACNKRYYPTISTKATTSATTSGSLARRSDLAASTTMFSITVTGSPAPPLATPTAISLTPTEFCLGLCEPVYDEDLDEYDASCLAGCTGNPDLSSTQVAAADRCYSTCPRGEDESVEDWNTYVTCLRACNDRYYSTTSTKTVTSTATSGSLARRSGLAGADVTTTFTTTTVTPAMSTYTSSIPNISPKESCIASCNSDDDACEVECLVYPMPYPGGSVAAAYGECEAACRKGPNTKEGTEDFRICVRICGASYYDPDEEGRLGDKQESTSDFVASPSAGTKVSAIAATNAGLGPRNPLTAASPTRTPTSAMSSATHTPSPKERCITSSGPKDVDCAVDCINAESHFPGQDAAAQECEAACREFIAMAKDPGGLPTCLMACAYSYDEVSTGNAQFTVTIPNSDLVPRATPTAASTSLLPTTTNTMLPATPSIYNPWVSYWPPPGICLVSCAASDLLCRHVCATEVAHCEAACPQDNTTPTGRQVLIDCIRACTSHYSIPGQSALGVHVATTSTSQGPGATLTAAVTTPQLAQRSLIPVDIVPDSPDIEVSPKELCLTKCSPGDIACKARCVGVPNPSPAQIAATNECEAACPQGNGTAAQTQFYAACLQKCVDSFYFSGTGTIAAGITATATTMSEGIRLESTTAEHPTVSRQIFKFASSSSTSSGSVTLRTHSATGSTASSSPTGGPASSGSAPKLGQAGGLFGLMMALLAL
ncbi:hypothetical protein LTR10_004377 [Elasticomyces elasticus]|nr:hypothetical protein LTR10_004377 [Elasticomyces elasticus]KAK4976694.1 hypothetical protein LTR42_002739 [Elasticomyces elasticus]